MSLPRWSISSPCGKITGRDIWPLLCEYKLCQTFHIGQSDCGWHVPGTEWINSNSVYLLVHSTSDNIMTSPTVKYIQSVTLLSHFSGYASTASILVLTLWSQFIGGYARDVWTVHRYIPDVNMTNRLAAVWRLFAATSSGIYVMIYQVHVFQHVPTIEQFWWNGVRLKFEILWDMFVWEYHFGDTCKPTKVE